MTTPENREYTVKDVLGNTYTWTGADPTNLPSVFTWSDAMDDTDMVLLHCHGDVFVNVAHVVSMTAAPVS